MPENLLGLQSTEWYELIKPGSFAFPLVSYSSAHNGRFLSAQPHYPRAQSLLGTQVCRIRDETRVRSFARGPVSQCRNLIGSHAATLLFEGYNHEPINVHESCSVRSTSCDVGGFESAVYREKDSNEQTVLRVRIDSIIIIVINAISNLRKCASIYFQPKPTLKSC